MIRLREVTDLNDLPALRPFGAKALRSRKVSQAREQPSHVRKRKAIARHLSRKPSSGRPYGNSRLPSVYKWNLNEW